MRLIDADALKNKMLECSKNCFSYGAYDDYYTGREYAYLDAADLIDEAPTVEKRKHGHWLRHNNIIACLQRVYLGYVLGGRKYRIKLLPQLWCKNGR